MFEKLPYHFISRIDTNRNEKKFTLNLSTIDAANDIKRRLDSYMRIYCENHPDKQPSFSFQLNEIENESAKAKIVFSGDLLASLEKLYEYSCLSDKQYEDIQRSMGLWSQTDKLVIFKKY